LTKTFVNSPATLPIRCESSKTLSLPNIIFAQELCSETPTWSLSLADALLELSLAKALLSQERFKEAQKLCLDV
jgi:hypothetical protein